jgi:glycerol-3-phosphate O-acyltransferase
LNEIIAGITLYFDKALGNNLLYRFERAQYVEQRRAANGKPMSEIYGAEHLLRLFGELSSVRLADRSQLWAVHRVHEHRPRVAQHLTRVHQRHHEVSFDACL